MGRGRPPKAEGDRKAKDLRIPVTDAQKALVAEATQLLPDKNMAAWARPILLDAAKAVIEAARAAAQTAPPARKSSRARPKPGET